MCPVPGCSRLESSTCTWAIRAPAAVIAFGRSSSSMFMWKRSAHHPHRAVPGRPLHLLAEVDRLLQPVEHVVLVPVDRLQGDPDALPGGVLAQLDQRLQQHRAVLGRLARRDERRQPQAEHPPAGRRQHPLAAELGDDAELRAQLRDRVPPPVGVEVADEVVGLRADGPHHHPGPGGGAQLRQPGGEMPVAAGAQLDAVEAGARGRTSNLAARVSPGSSCSWQESLTQASLRRSYRRAGGGWRRCLERWSSTDHASWGCPTTRPAR